MVRRKGVGDQLGKGVVDTSVCSAGLVDLNVEGEVDGDSAADATTLEGQNRFLPLLESDQLGKAIDAGLACSAGLPDVEVESVRSLGVGVEMNGPRAGRGQRGLSCGHLSKSNAAHGSRDVGSLEEDVASAMKGGEGCVSSGEEVVDVANLERMGARYKELKGSVTKERSPSMVDEETSNGNQLSYGTLNREGKDSSSGKCASASNVDKDRDLDSRFCVPMVSPEERGSSREDGDQKKRGRPLRSGKAKGKGAANADLGRQLRFLISKYHIKLVVLVETKTSGEKCLKLRRKIGFDSSFVEEAQGFSGGIWVLWKSQDAQVDVRQGMSNWILL
ncbi:hypothetical protein K1719_029738 [Acacia pycnantha]|nr:hypothetical protein K1719_029738 [Acacia pycnantha]